MLRTVITAFALVAAVASAAQARPSTLGMSCGQANALVAQSGAIVLSTGRNTYDRFVAGPGFCLLGEYAWPGRAPTADGFCRLAYICKPGRSPYEERLFDD